MPLATLHPGLSASCLLETRVPPPHNALQTALQLPDGRANTMPTLYHYTSGAGLQGILESKSLWASDYRFLNDTSEFRYGFAILSQFIEMYADDIRGLNGDWLLLNSLRTADEKTGVIAFVASLSTEGDLLSQWRGYNGGKGYSIGFNSDWLNQNAQKQSFKMFPVLYEREAQEKAADSAVRLLLDMLKDLKGDPVRVFETMTQWWEHAIAVALAFKDRHFSEEHEYRLAYIGRSWPTNVKVRSANVGLVPYYPCRFDVEIINNAAFHPNNLGIERIIVGPAFKQQQSAAVDALLAMHHMRFQIDRSEIPYTAD